MVTQCSGQTVLKKSPPSKACLKTLTALHEYVDHLNDAALLPERGDRHQHLSKLALIDLRHGQPIVLASDLLNEPVGEDVCVKIPSVDPGFDWVHVRAAQPLEVNNDCL